MTVQGSAVAVAAMIVQTRPTRNAPAGEFVLWGYKPSMCPLGVPIKIRAGTPAHCRAGARERRAEGWVFGYAPKYSPAPAGMRDQYEREHA